MSKQTAVEFLFKHLECVKIIDGYEFIKLQQVFEQAKAMEREQMLELISFVRVHNKMGKRAEDLLQQFEEYKGGEQ